MQRQVVMICGRQYALGPGKSSTDTNFALRILMEKYREAEKELQVLYRSDRWLQGGGGTARIKHRP